MTEKISDTIKQDLAHQLETYSDLPFKLTLGAIADYYSVSLTPVRLVIEGLIDDGLLERKDNGRLERLVQPVSVSPQPATNARPLNRQSELDEQVASDLVRLCVCNHQDYLREEATAKKYGIGRTAMRQIFSRLAGLGLVEHVPRCGWKVRPFREQDMVDYLEMRELLEVKALQLARPRLKLQDLQRMLDGNIASESPQQSAIDNDLHQYWISRCDNFYIQDFFKRHGTFYTTLFDYASVGKTVKTEMAQEHRDILEALIEQDWARAEAELVRHIRDQKSNVLRLLQFQPVT